MGFFDFLKKKKKDTIDFSKSNVNTSTTTQLKNDNKQKTAYTNSTQTTVHDIKVTLSSSAEKKVITFEERKKTTYPSSNGLYPAEILLLDYCNKGRYPVKKNLYPSFWWFEYGIRDVDSILKSLEERRYILFASVKDSVGSLTVQHLKDLLSAKNVSMTGKKSDLIQKVSASYSEDELISGGIETKYKLTELGLQELEANAYVPFMHSVHNKTGEDDDMYITFNVWAINKILGDGDKSNWKEIVAERERIMNKSMELGYEKFMEELKVIDPEGYQELRRQDEEIAAAQKS